MISYGVFFAGVVNSLGIQVRPHPISLGSNPKKCLGNWRPAAADDSINDKHICHDSSSNKSHTPEVLTCMDVGVASGWWWWGMGKHRLLTPVLEVALTALFILLLRQQKNEKDIFNE